MTMVVFFLLLVMTITVGCSEKEEDYGTGVRPDGPSYVPKDCVFTKRGLNNALAVEDAEDLYHNFLYTDYLPLKDKPVNVYYYIPEEGDLAVMPLLFSLTGAERIGNTQLNSWRHLADAYGFAVINPQFGKELYSENEYQFGGVTQEKGSEVIVDREKWTYNIIESLFDYWCKETDSDQTGYRIFGHSAGAQFVARMVMAMPEARIISAVAANPSSWPWPTPEGLTGTDGNVYGWPYSIKGLPVADKDTLARALSRQLFIQVGTEDTGTDSLDEGSAANAQGERRYERGRNFHQACVDAAEKLGVECAYGLAEVDGVGHSTVHMVYGYYKPTVSKTDEADLGPYSAFRLLFK